MLKQTEGREPEMKSQSLANESMDGLNIAFVVIYFAVLIINSNFWFAVHFIAIGLYLCITIVRAFLNLPLL